MVLYILKNRDENNRLGITVSKKIGGAVVRNRVRRKIRECYRLLEDEMEVGYDICFVARHRAVEEPFFKMQSSMSFLLKKSGIIK